MNALLCRKNISDNARIASLLSGGRHYWFFFWGGGRGSIFSASDNGSWLWLLPKRVGRAPPLRVWSWENWDVPSE